MPKLTQAKLKELLHYDQETGIFTRKVTAKHNAKRDDIAGWENKGGYLCISIDNKTYIASRLAWLYEFGYFPENEIDHKDKISHHNWIDNLRELSHQCNSRNCGNPKNNTSSVKGVVWDKPKQKWRVQIIINKKCKNIGRYKSFDNAVCARLAAEQCLNWSNCDSSSPAYQYVKNHIQI